jgi:hypothetical protein
VGETREIVLRVPLHSIGYWSQRFVDKGISYQTLENRFNETVLPFIDPDGVKLALVGIAGAENEPPWCNGNIPTEHAIRGLQGVTLFLDGAEMTVAILTEVLSFREVAPDGSVIRFVVEATVDFNPVSPGIWLLKKVPWSEAEHHIRAVNADQDVATHLDIAEGDACLVVERRTRHCGRVITFVVLSYPGSGYQMVAHFSPSTAYAFKTKM